MGNSTVFVLGAGASQPLFPLGRQLTNQVIQILSDRSSVTSSLNFHLDHRKALVGALSEANLPSVDNFLEKRPEFVELGKAAIAECLIRLENLELLRRKDLRPNWYDYLWEKIASKSSTLDKLNTLNIKIITFNYDRSLEQYLYGSVLNAFGKAPFDTAQAMFDFEFVHLHGSLGVLPWQNDSSRFTSRVRKYDHNAASEEILIAAKSIRIIHEGVSLEKDETFSAARRILSNAARVYFLGFGFHPTNVRRLGLFDFARAEMKATATGLTSNEVNSLNTYLKGIVKFSRNSNDCLGFVRNEVIWE